jgi:cell wall-associated NlpC family hydrolase
MPTIRNLKEEWANNAPFMQKRVSNMQNKVSQLYGSGTQNENPFLDKNGNLFNEYLNYQNILDNPAIAAKAKQFISAATGLTPSQTAPATTAEPVSTAPVSDSPAAAAPTGNNIADTAQKYLGTPYVWGGESMDEGGMDCSGFVYNALKDAGYNVGRTTAQGYRSYGNSVSKSEMQPGDLIFFGKNGKASHIGIYLGNGQMIHSAGGSKNTKANPGKGVSVVNVNHRSDFLEARRY